MIIKLLLEIFLGCLLTVAPKDDWTKKDWDKKDLDKIADLGKKDKGDPVPGQKNYTFAGMDVLSVINDGKSEDYGKFVK